MRVAVVPPGRENDIAEVGGWLTSGWSSARSRSSGAGDVAVVTINRPEVRNAIDRPTALALAAVLEAFDADDDLAVGVLTGAVGASAPGSTSRRSALRSPIARPCSRRTGTRRPARRGWR
jgi:hypothetical protein